MCLPNYVVCLDRLMKLSIIKLQNLEPFLLYTGLIVLKGNFKNKFYFHFMLLIFFSSILIITEKHLLNIMNLQVIF
jgi:hypothetical protein